MVGSNSEDILKMRSAVSMTDQLNVTIERMLCEISGLSASILLESGTNRHGSSLVKKEGGLHETSQSRSSIENCTCVDS